MASFTTLADALRFFSDCADSDDGARLHAACHERKGCTESAFRTLKYFHAQKPLAEMYAGREFPDTGREFKLGGHGAELGHLHIDFVRERSGWRLESLWVCR